MKCTSHKTNVCSMVFPEQRLQTTNKCHTLINNYCSCCSRKRLGTRSAPVFKLPVAFSVTLSTGVRVVLMGMGDGFANGTSHFASLGGRPITPDPQTLQLLSCASHSFIAPPPHTPPPTNPCIPLFILLSILIPSYNCHA